MFPKWYFSSRFFADWYWPVGANVLTGPPWNAIDYRSTNRTLDYRSKNKQLES